MKAAELSIAAPQVAALRVARMLAAGVNPSARDRREFERMGTEKVLAFWESMNAMGMEMAKAQQHYALLAMRQWWSPWLSPWSAAASAARVLDKGLGPVHRRASANARRLRRLRRS
ncbi:MAG: polyhydroxyalkanoate granule-associated phasin [Burkholderiales bacterium]